MADVDPLTMFETAAPPATTAVPTTAASDPSDPLTMFNTTAPVTAAPSEPDIDPITGFPLDSRGKPIAGAPSVLAGKDQGTLAPGSGDSAKRIGEAAVQGYRDSGNPLMSATLQDMIEKSGPVGRYLTSPLLQLGGNALALGGGAYKGLQQGAVELGGGDAGPGRDLAAYMEVAPMLARETPVLRGEPAPPSAAPQPRFIQEHYGEGLPGNPLAAAPAPATPDFIPPQHALLPPQPPEVPAFVPPGTQPFGNALAGPEAGGRTPVAAATPPTPAAPAVIPNGLTPAQVAEFKNIPDTLPPSQGPIKTQADAEARADQIIDHFASIGNRTPIPGATGALPTITGNSGIATLYRAVRDSDTPVPFTTLENASKTDAMGQLKTMAGTPEDLAAAKATRATTVKPMYDAAFANKTDADFAAPTQTAQDILKSPLGQNDTVAGELPSIIKKLQGQTDPEQLKGIADNIDATLDRLGTEGKADRQTRMALGQVKDSIMSSISDATPGFDAAQAEFSKQSRRIDEMTYLQGRKLTDLQGNPTLGNMRSTIDDISKKQAGDKFNPADSVTPDNMATLQRLHDQMQREQLTQSAGKALGSNTFQNMATNSTVGNIAGHFANHLVNSTIGAGLDFATGLHGYGIGGTLAGNALAYGAEGVKASQAAKATASAAAGQKMLMQALRDRLLNINNAGVQSLTPR